MASEHVNLKRWYVNGEKTDIYDRTMQRNTGQTYPIFSEIGTDRYSSPIWGLTERSKFNLIESEFPPRISALHGAQTKTSGIAILPRKNRDIKILGVAIGRRRIDFVRTRYVNQMGRVEDIAVGYGYSMSMGYGSPFYGSDRSETLLKWLFFLITRARRLLLLEYTGGLHNTI